MINQKVRGSRIENQYNSIIFGTILAPFIENPENPEESWVTFSGFFTGKYQCIYMYLLYIIIIIIIIIPIFAFSWKTERPLLKMWKTKYFIFWGGPPPSGFQDFAQIGVKSLVSLPNKPEKWLQDYSCFSGFLPRKKDIVSSELLLHLKNIQCNR